MHLLNCRCCAEQIVVVGVCVGRHIGVCECVDGDADLPLDAFDATAAARKTERVIELLARVANAAARGAPRNDRAQRYIEQAFLVLCSQTTFYLPRALVLPRRIVAFSDPLLAHDACAALGYADDKLDTIDGATVAGVLAAVGDIDALVLNFNTPLTQSVPATFIKALGDECEAKQADK